MGIEGQDKELLRENKEALLREHFHAVWQLAFSYLKDKPRAQSASKAVFCRAFAAMDEGADMVAVSLELRGYTLEEVLQMKEAEPSPEMDLYRTAGEPVGAPPYGPAYTAAAPYGYSPYYYGSYLQPYVPPYQQPAYPPFAPYPAYAPPPQAYAPPTPSYAPPAYTSYAPPPPQAPPQPEAAAGTRTGAAPRRKTVGQEAEARRAAAAARAQDDTPRPYTREQAWETHRKTPEKKAAQEAPEKIPIPPQEAPEPAPVLPQEAPEPEPDPGPPPYEGPTEEQLNEEFVPHEITMTPEMEARRRKRARNARIILALNIVAVSAMVWVVLGLLRRIGLLTELDLGYTWFNANLFKIF